MPRQCSKQEWTRNSVHSSVINYGLCAILLVDFVPFITWTLCHLTVLYIVLYTGSVVSLIFYYRLVPYLLSFHYGDNKGLFPRACIQTLQVLIREWYIDVQDVLLMCSLHGVFGALKSTSVACSESHEI